MKPLNKIAISTRLRWKIANMKDWIENLIYGEQHYIFVPVEVRTNENNYISALRSGGFKTVNDAAFVAVNEAVEYARFYCDDPELLKIKEHEDFPNFQSLWNEGKFSDCIGIWNTWFAPFYGNYYNVLSIGFNRTEFKEHYDTTLSFQELIAD